MTDAGPVELRLLDRRGCLTPEALCFSEELEPHLREAVERHLRCCPVCAQQQLAMVRLAARVRRVRPRFLVPPEAKVVARQLAMRSLVQWQEAEADATRNPTDLVVALRDPWYRSRGFWGALLVGIGAAVILAAAVLLVL